MISNMKPMLARPPDVALQQTAALAWAFGEGAALTPYRRTSISPLNRWNGPFPIGASARDR
jgi:hypothetical protein